MSNPVIDCLLAHRSVRRYRPEPVPEETVRTIIEAGTRAATAGNLQLYSFLVIDDEPGLAWFEPHLVPGISRPPLIVVALVDLHRVRRWLEVHEAASPVLDRPVYFMLGMWDTLIALQNVVVAAESLGLGSCFYGPVLELDLAEAFGTPEHVFPAGMVCLGFPATEPRRSQRLPLEAVMHRNRYHHFDDATIRKLYRERDAVWESVSAERREELSRQGIGNIAQALAVQRFSDEETGRRSAGIRNNLRRAGFRIDSSA